MNCAIAGASGLVGGSLLQSLITDDQFQKIFFCARSQPLSSSAKIQFLQTDFKTFPAVADTTVDVAFCCLGTTIKKAGSAKAFNEVDHDFVISFAKWSKEKGAKKFLIVSALGADAQSSVFYNRVKGQTENDLRNIGFSSTVIARPSLLLGERAEKRLGEKLAIDLFPFYSPLLIGGLKKYTPIKASRVAEFLHQQSKQGAKGFEIFENHQML